MKLKRIIPGYYKCVDYPNYTITKINNRVWVGRDFEKTTGDICCSGPTLKKVKEIIMKYIEEGCWYK